MFDDLFEGLFENGAQNAVEMGNFLLLLGCSLCAGAFLSLIYAYKSRYTKSFLITLGILPAVVCVVIMLVNGNLGAGVAVAGAFSLVRFRSAPGSAKEIAVLFLAMACGLAMGMGYVMYGFIFTIVVGVVLVILQNVKFKQSKKVLLEKTLKITIPEDLNYTGLFSDIFQQYTKDFQLVSVKTVNLGSMFKLTYNITEKDIMLEKEMLDALRVRNGNLEIAIFEREISNAEL